MKKHILRIALLAAVLCLLAVAVFAAEGDFNAGLDIAVEGNTIRVTVQHSNVFQTNTPKLTIPTGMDWPWAKVTFRNTNTVLDDVTWDAASKSVTFPVEKGGTYVIEAAEKPEEEAPVDPVVPSVKPAEKQEEVLQEAPVFADVHDAGHWAADSIDFVTTRGLFNGVTEDTFQPDNTMTRAMLMTVLARLDGVSTEGGANWYDKGMQWAMSNGISDGTNPGGSITREQLVTMLWRYAGEPDAAADLSAYPDADEVSGYAAEAMAWAVKTGLINGIDGKLSPLTGATRAQVAAVLMRYWELVR